ncbi:MAG TPA: extensin family protein [Polyangiaceae bacterium]|nr:extensin family protein [Polyangiaceae bacterium]
MVAKTGWGLLGFLLCAPLATATQAKSASVTPGPIVAPAPQPAVVAVRSPGSADLDPSNDFEVAPPDIIENCEALLKEAGVQFKTAELPVHKQKKNTFDCGAAQAVQYRRGPGEIRYSSSPILSCPMALGLARFERVIQEEAQRAFASRVRRIVHVGSYACREMARYPGWVSEHSYANALDIKEFELQNGRTITVLRHYDSTRKSDTAAREFLHTLLHRAYRDNIFSVALGPPFDALHRDHFHLDEARYRVDGTGP